jgi:hypothetical protein
VQGAQRTGHDDQPGVVPQQWREGAQHPGGAEVVHPGVGVDDLALLAWTQRLALTGPAAR